MPSPVPVEVFLIGRTLRGTLGEAFRAEVVALFENEHPGEAPVHTALSRTVELTVVAVTRAGAISVDAVIADPAFGQRMPVAATTAPGAGRQLFEVVAESVEGIRPVGGPQRIPSADGPAGADRSRRILVSVESAESLAFAVRVVSRD
ncbi:hypothetical protein [Herbiconiux solani]|uniref:hypothetical protein n=1 Tax=Herbiconiux solani TaxID=661329 RepID=UPI0008240828|nr:hypothetical protein [Herbiconiux solani]